MDLSCFEILREGCALRLNRNHMNCFNSQYALGLQAHCFSKDDDKHTLCAVVTQRIILVNPTLLSAAL